jgi:clathrin heavy chain
MTVANQSADAALVQKLLRFFVDNKNHECFAACLYQCYDFVAPDVVLELGWKNKILDHTFPYLVQFVKEYAAKVSECNRRARACAMQDLTRACRSTNWWRRRSRRR